LYNTGGEYGTALQAASRKGNLDIVKLLLEKQADPNIQGAGVFLFQQNVLLARTTQAASTGRRSRLHF
jgi:ankyrin repeat protein